MRFFSKLVFICNICFLATIIMRYLETQKRKVGNKDAIIPLQFVEGTLVVLGYVAIILNFVFLLWALGSKAGGKKWSFPLWIFWLNLLIFFLQTYFFFFYQG